MGWPSPPSAFSRKSPPFYVCELTPLSFKLILKNTALFYKIVDDRLLLAVKSAGQGTHESMEWLYDRGQYTNSFSVILPDNTIIRFVRILAPYGQIQIRRILNSVAGMRKFRDSSEAT